MKPLLVLILTLITPLAKAELYKCTLGTKTLYQDKPCKTHQTQTVIPPAPPPPKPVNSPSASISTNTPIARDKHGKIKRSQKAKNDFKAANPCPANGKKSGSCPGYVIDHINPLACGGVDSPENMQWQTVAAGKEKDKWERTNCKPKVKRRKK